MRQLKITKSITSRDSEAFNKYLTEVSNLGDVITPEEEIELARKIKTGDLAAREKLVNANLRFVVSVAKQYNGKAPLVDLIQEGNIGLIKAAERFDETRGFKFISYAVWWIRQSIMQSLADDSRQIRLPLNKIGTLNKINQTISELTQIYERIPTEEEISEYLMIMESQKPNGEPSKYTIEKIKNTLYQGQNISSIDAPMTTESDSGSMSDILPGENEYDINKILKNKDLQIELKMVLERFTFRERDVLILYFGLFGNNPMSLEEIGMRYELTRERVRQIKEKAIRKLKHRTRSISLKEFI